MANRSIIVIGASAGGLQVLQTIVSAFPWDFQASVFIVLHTTEDSPGLLPQILNRYSKVPVMYAVHNAPILPSRVYVAPVGKRHMLLDRGNVRVEHGPRENVYRYLRWQQCSGPQNIFVRNCLPGTLNIVLQGFCR